MLTGAGRHAIVGAFASVVLVLLASQSADAAPAWLTPVSLAETGFIAECPVQTAMDPQGDAFALWNHYSGANASVQLSARPAGGSWQAPTDFPQEGGVCPEEMAVDARGDAIATWARYNGKITVAESTYRPAGGSWQAPVAVVTEPGTEVVPARIAMDSEGDAIAVWRSNASHFVESSYRPAGGSWQAPVTVSSEAGNGYEPDVAMDAKGDAVAVWRHFPGAGEEVIQAAFKPAGGVWSATADLSKTAPEVHPYGAVVAIDSADEALAVWGRSNGTNQIIQAAAMQAGGSWQPAVNLSEAGQSAERPQLAMDTQGDAVAIWERNNGTEQIIQAASRPAGGVWQPAANLSEGGHSASFPQVAIDSKGDAVGVWNRYNGANEVIQGASRPASGGWQGPVNLSEPGQNTYQPDVSMDAQGDAVAVWERGANPSWTVQAAGYDAAGPLLNGLSIPTSGTAGQPVSFSVSPFDVWSALGNSSWSFGDGASASGASVTHTYAAAGSYHVTLASADLLGNATSASGTIVIAPSPTINAPKQLVPTISAVRQSASSWREGSKLAHISKRNRKPPVGTTFSFALNEQAKVSLSFTQTLSGRRTANKCLATNGKNAKHKRCSRTVTVGTITFTGHSATNKVSFQGRISRSRKLKPGRYTLVITATNSAGASVPQSLGFTIVE